MPKRQGLPLWPDRLPIRFDVYGVRGAITALRGTTPAAMARLLGLFGPAKAGGGKGFLQVAFKPALRITEISVFITPHLARKKIWGIHAAALLYKGRAFLFPGPSNSGKSTLARTALKAGLKIVGDDFVLFKRERNGITLLPYFCCVHKDNEAKAVRLLPPSRLGRGPLQAVLFPRRTPGRTRLRRIESPLDVLKRLWPRVLWAEEVRLFHQQEKAVRAMACVPAFHLDLGRDMLRNPRILLSALDNITKEC